MGKNKVKLSKTEFKNHVSKFKEVKLDVGCGLNKKVGYIGIDVFNVKGVDLILDLEKNKLPLKNNSVDIIYTSHFLEHVDNPIDILKEFNRVLKIGGKLTIIVPHYTNPYAYHFTHKSFWSSYSLDSNYLRYYLNSNLLLISKKVNIKYFSLIDPILTKLANLSLRTYERIFANFINAWEIEFELIKLKKIEKELTNVKLH